MEGQRQAGINDSQGQVRRFRLMRCLKYGTDSAQKREQYRLQYRITDSAACRTALISPAGCPVPRGGRPVPRGGAAAPAEQTPPHHSDTSARRSSPTQVAPRDARKQQARRTPRASRLLDACSHREGTAARELGRLRQTAELNPPPPACDLHTSKLALPKRAGSLAAGRGSAGGGEAAAPGRASCGDGGGGGGGGGQVDWEGGPVPGVAPADAGPGYRVDTAIACV